MSDIVVLDIIDTAVKIGLGALISGGVAYLITNANHKNEKLKWLREQRFQAFSALSEELLSLGFENLSFDDEYKLNAISSKAVLLIEDKELIEKIEDFIKRLVLFSTYERPKIIKTANEDVVVDGEIIGKEKDLLVGLHLTELQDEARSIVYELNQNLINLK